MKQTIHSLGVLSVAKISALVYGAIGLIFVPFCLAFAIAASSAGKTHFGFAGPVVLVCALLIPLFYAGMGFVVGAIGAAIYNVVAGWVGGIEVELHPAGGAVMAARQP